MSVGDLAYRPGFESLLLLRFGEKHHRFSWKLFWRSVLQRACCVWCLAKKLDMRRRVAVRQRIMRFLSSAGLVPMPAANVVVPARDPRHVTVFKRALREHVAASLGSGDPWVLRFCFERIRIFQGTPVRMNDTLQCQWRAVAELDRDS
jgi:hypothetical protein